MRTRHAELVRIEQSLAELASLFADVATLVEQQEAAVEDVEQNAGKTVEYLDRGIEQVGQATESAKRAKRLKWWCLFVSLLIVAVVALVLGIGFGVLKWGSGN